MRGLIVAMGLLAALPAAADDWSTGLDQRHQHRTFWLTQSWTEARREMASNTATPKFTTTYTQGIVQRFGVGANGHVDFFQRNLGSGGDPSAPALVGTVNNGAAMLALRWHTGE